MVLIHKQIILGYLSAQISYKCFVLYNGLVMHATSRVHGVYFCGRIWLVTWFFFLGWGRFVQSRTAGGDITIIIIMITTAHSTPTQGRRLLPASRRRLLPPSPSAAVKCVRKWVRSHMLVRTICYLDGGAQCWHWHKRDDLPGAGVQNAPV